MYWMLCAAGCDWGEWGVYIGGDGVARGYLNRPELTAEQFLPDPFSKTPARRLCTGRVIWCGICRMGIWSFWGGWISR